MDYNKSTIKEKTNLLAKYTKIVNRLLNGYVDESGEHPKDPKVAQYIQWESIPYNQAQDCYAQWNKYYEDVKKTRTYQIYKEMSEALAVDDLYRVRELHKEVKERMSEGKVELHKPEVTNPYDFLNSQSVEDYKKAMWNKKALEKESKDLDNGIFN
jgi:hypothetical protein